MFDFEKTMLVKSDSELLQVIHEEGKYQKEAVIAARNELSKRNLPMAKIDEAMKIYLNNKAIDDSKENAPLDGFWKLLTFFLPAVMTIILSGYLKAGGV